MSAAFFSYTILIGREKFNVFDWIFCSPDAGFFRVLDTS